MFLVNARDAKHVPGRKTDGSDAQWPQRLHSFGLLRASFGPKGQIAELCAYLRQRERLLEYGASHIQHMQKALTEMNVQLHHVVTDITDSTGLRIIRAILAGERNPAVLARMRDRCHATVETIEKALAGNYRIEHLFILEQALALYDTYQQKAFACDARIEAVLKELSVRCGREGGQLPPARQNRSRQQNSLGAMHSPSPRQNLKPKIQRKSLRHACRPPAPASSSNQLSADLGIPFDSLSSANALMPSRFRGTLITHSQVRS